MQAKCENVIDGTYTSPLSILFHFAISWIIQPAGHYMGGYGGNINYLDVHCVLSFSFIEYLYANRRQVLERTDVIDNY